MKKHGVSFSEAATAFEDENIIIMADENHSEQEERFVIIGFSHRMRLLVVCHCYRENDGVIRIISARKATKHETNVYGGAI